MKTLARAVLFASAWLLCTLAADGALAQSYPAKRVTMLTSFPPGGGTDLLARLVSQKLSERWGQPFIVDNRVGGNGIVGARAAAGAPPDGYTLYMGSSNHLVLLHAQFDNMPFETLRDLSPVTPVAFQHAVLVVHPSMPVRSLKDLIDYGKARPGVLNFASPGIGGYEHLAMLHFISVSQLQATHVPYKGSADAVAALLGGGEVSSMFGSIATVTPQIKAGRLRPLTITAATRSLALPDVQTAAEAGLPDFVMYSWNGVFAPAGTPKDVVAKLNGEILAILRLPDVIERLTSLGFVANGLSPEEFAALIRSETDRWSRIVKNLGIEKQKL
ncbi:MAG: tripartite tricarboxylate transporter substrate binding protein [Betaproteobacteria bacterium]|nr:tripartite tricarboxylate transporter substrate binding protein [Betaproteobacteria bacterium]